MAYLIMPMIITGLVMLVRFWWINQQNVATSTVDTGSPQRGVAEIAAESIEYWTIQIAKSTTLDETNYCFGKAREAQQDIATANEAAEQARYAVVAADNPAPDNLYQLHP